MNTRPFLLPLLALLLTPSCARVTQTRTQSPQGGSGNFKSAILDNDPLEDPVTTQPPAPAANEKLITILGTNDIHGGVEMYPDKNGGYGGMQILASVVKSIRHGLNARFGGRVGVLLLDAGDQFQGTLLSNYDEGQLVFRLMNSIGYDAAIPGNHDYDFGPRDWRRDKISDTTEDFDDLNDKDSPSVPSVPDNDPRGALKLLMKLKKFSVISANTYLAASIQDSEGHPLGANGVGCKVADPSKIDWSRAQRPDYLLDDLKQPLTHKIFNVARVRVAVIGMDHPATTTVTTLDNVLDLCFRDPFDSYVETQKSLQDQADVFVLLMHDGNATGDSHVTRLVDRIVALPNHPLDAVIAGHTHFANRKFRSGVPLIQSNSDGKYFGRVDLIWDTQAKQVVREKTWAMNSIRLNAHTCDKRAAPICQATGTGNQAAVSYEGVPIAPLDAETGQIIAEARAKINTIAALPLGKASAVIKPERDVENALSDRVTDAMRERLGADVAIVNGGGLRAPINVGPITYETLYRVIPFNNRAWMLGPVTVSQLVTLYEISAQSCGAHGSLFQSGLRIEYSRDCRRAVNQIDSQAHVELIATADGEVVYDRSKPDLKSNRTFQVATVDFLGNGGSGYTPFRTLTKPADYDKQGVMREQLRKLLTVKPAVWADNLDGRWKNRIVGGDPATLPAPTATPKALIGEMTSPTTESVENPAAENETPPVPSREEWAEHPRP